VEGFDFRPSNLYIFVRVIPSCFRVPVKSPVNVWPEIFYIIILGSCTLFTWTGGARFSSCGERDVDRHESVTFYSPCFNQFCIGFAVSIKKGLDH
jgi:hypothetical protein